MSNIISPIQQLYLAWDISHKKSVSDDSRFTGVLSEAKVDLNPHQVDAALFAFKSPLSKGAILADEVGLGKTIEAGIILSELWAEHKRKIIIIVPASLRNQWNIELMDKFFLPSTILTSDTFSAYKSAGINPLNDSKNIIICSYNFAAKYVDDIKNIHWDLVIYDEAHKLRNVYKPKNIISQTLKKALKPYKKVLLTATPLQNSLKELYGLISIIDDNYFSTVDTFEAQYNGITTRDSAIFGELKDRLQRIVHRTLRNQVQEYVNYTKRSALVQRYEPTPQEQYLYEVIDAYLKRDFIYAIHPMVRPMLSLIIRKILSSSSYALSYTLRSLIKRLEEYKACGKQPKDDSEIRQDFEGEENDIFIEEDFAIGETYDESYTLDQEISDLRHYRELALSITVETKALKLIDALKTGFEMMAKVGARRKALIFTESRKTQEYLKHFLSEHGYRDKIVCFNGDNSDFAAKCIYENWLNKYAGTHRISGSKEIDRKQALVDFFESNADIMIATEAGAEGINLQFCSMVVNYDMPWNPQRIEQRIGRCHRYGQKHDVVVVNFVNDSNIADNRVYELLNNKFNLFDGVFGCSDEILGAIDSGVGFEKRLNQIFQKCRTAEEIEAAFDELQKELQDVINERINQTKKSLLENFDEEVVGKLKVRHVEDNKRVNAFIRNFWTLTKSVLKDDISSVDDSELSFVLNTAISPEIPLGKYILNKDSGSNHQLRISHPLGEYILKRGLDSPTDDLHIVFNLDNYPFRKSLLEEHRGTSGVSYAYKVYSHNEYDSQEDLIFCSVTEDGIVLSTEFCSSLLQIIPDSYSKIALSTDESIDGLFDEKLKELLENLSDRTNEYISFEIDKFESWSEDQVYKIQSEVIELRKQHEAIRRQIRKESNARIKLALKEQEVKLAKELRQKQQKFFEMQDQCADQVDKLTERLRKSMENTIEHGLLFKFSWKIMS